MPPVMDALPKASSPLCVERFAGPLPAALPSVDYGGTAEELESHFNSCGQINRVTILCDKFSGHPKGYAYIEFEEKSSVKAAVALDESMFRGRVIKVLPKRTNMPGISSTDRGGYRGRFHARGGLSQRGSYFGGQRSRVRGRTYR
nr:PREDICTED: embryonic polyadenylate-binding protein 2-B-like [Apteryx mantelli mantelli]